MKKILRVMALLVAMICVLGIVVGCNKKEKKGTDKPAATVEPYEIYPEWKAEYFHQFGFENLLMPADVYNESCEVGKTYVVGTFYTDDFSKFSYLFKVIYRQLWGNITDVTKVLAKENGVYSFEDECVIPDVVIANNENEGQTDEEQKEQYMKIKFIYDTNENKASVEFRKIDKLEETQIPVTTKPTKKTKNKK